MKKLILRIKRGLLRRVRKWIKHKKLLLHRFFLKLKGYEIRVSYSQQLEDVYVYHNLMLCPDRLANAWIIEIGAFDGVTYSNSKFFEDNFGSKCVLVEPSSTNFEKLKINRPFSSLQKCAIGSSPGPQIFFSGGAVGGLSNAMSDQHRDRWLSCFECEETVLVKTFSSLVEELDISHVHFLSIDCEGGDLNVLKSIDFTSVEIDIILVEAQQEFTLPISSLLEEASYVLDICLFGNQIWLSSSYHSFLQSSPDACSRSKMAWHSPFLEEYMRSEAAQIAAGFKGSPVVFW